MHSLEWRRVWYGSWDPTGIESPFFRPLTAWLFAVRFWLFGLNTAALHTISVAGHVVCAIGVGGLLRREGTSRSIALGGVWLYAVHPLFPYAQVSWLTNQMHLAESIVVIAALLVWQSVRDRSVLWSAALIPFAVAGFLIKEDAVMVLPVLLVLTALRTATAGSLPLKRLLTLLVIVALVLVGLIAFRHQRLGRLGGYGVPSTDQALTQFWKGLDAALLLWPTRTPWQAVAAAIALAAVGVLIARRKHGGSWPVALAWGSIGLLLATTLPALFYTIDYPLIAWQGIASGIVLAASLAGAGIAAARRMRGPLLIMATGAVIAVGFNVPFALVSKREQYHLLALGAVLVLAGSLAALRMAVAKPRYVLPVAAIASLPMALLARDQATAFAPCEQAVLTADADVAGWWVVPDEIKTWLLLKRPHCDRGLLPPAVRELPVVAWGMHGEQDDQEVAYRWTSDEAVLLVRRDIPVQTLALRHPDASTASPIRVTVTGGTAPIDFVLDAPDWRFATLRFSDGILERLRQAHRVDIRVSPWFVPALRDPAQQDLRRYGVQFRIVVP